MENGILDPQIGKKEKNGRKINIKLGAFNKIRKRYLPKQMPEKVDIRKYFTAPSNPTGPLENESNRLTNGEIQLSRAKNGPLNGLYPKCKIPNTSPNKKSIQLTSSSVNAQNPKNAGQCNGNQKEIEISKEELKILAQNLVNRSPAVLELNCSNDSSKTLCRTYDCKSMSQPPLQINGRELVPVLDRLTPSTTCVDGIRLSSSAKNILKNLKRKSLQPLEVSIPDKRRKCDKLATKTTSTQNQKQVTIDTYEDPFEVETIINYSWCKEKCEGLYFVKWIGYPESQNTWEPLEHLECHEKLKEFYALRLKEREKALPGRKRFLEVPPDPRTRFERSSETADKICPPPCMSEVEAFFVKLGPNQKDNAWPQSKLDHQLDLIAKAKKTNNVYEKRRELVKEQIMLRHVKEKRAEQIKNLKEWEEEINAIDRLSRGNAKNAKITLENEYDLEGPPRHMNYINVYKPCQGIIIPDDPPIGCECLDGKCGIGTEKTCCPAFNGHRMSYTQFGRLRVELGTPIYECNKICKCDQDCTNRVVQKGRKVKLCIYRTSNGCGWGVKALERIKKGSFVVEYVGEVITSEEAEERGKTYDAEGRTYLFDLDFNMGDQNPYTVDAAFYGNVSHFINHSCDPNLSIFNVWIDCLDPNLPRLCLFANRDISKNEQLSFDYRQRTGHESADESNTLPVEELHEHTKMECRCGAPQCRKILFG